MMELIDTVENMVSDDFIKRLQAEFDQLGIRARGLSNFISAVENGEKECDRYELNLLKVQLSVMQQYKDILNKRLSRKKRSA